MKRFLRIVSVFIAVLMLACVFAGCTSVKNELGYPTEAPSSEAAATEAEAGDTEAPEATDAAAETEAPSPTDEPGDGSGALEWVKVPFDEEFACDLKGDGSEARVLIATTAEDEYDLDYTVGIDSDGSERYERAIPNCYDGYAILVTDRSGSTKPALVVCVWQDSDDPTTFFFRMDEKGEVACFEDYVSISDPVTASPVEEGWLAVYTRTELMGTCSVKGLFAVGDGELVLISDDYTYSEGFGPLTVLKDLPVTIDDDVETFDTTAAQGITVTPISTDLASYVYVKLSSGDYAYVKYDSCEYPFNINGEPQSDYLDVQYCD